MWFSQNKSVPLICSFRALVSLLFIINFLMCYQFDEISLSRCRACGNRTIFFPFLCKHLKTNLRGILFSSFIWCEVSSATSVHSFALFLSHFFFLTFLTGDWLSFSFCSKMTLSLYLWVLMTYSNWIGLKFFWEIIFVWLEMVNIHRYSLLLELGPSIFGFYYQKPD